MTNTTPNAPLTPAAPAEDVIKGGMFALLALPLGVIVLVLLASVGFVASIVGYVVAISAVWLYRRGSGGFISRNGAFVVAGIVVVTLLVGIWATLAVGFVGGLGHLGLLGDPRFAPEFSDRFGALVNENLLYIVLILGFGVLGSFRTLRRTFTIASQPRTQEQLFGQAPAAGPSSASSSSTTPTATYRNDVDGAPSGSADDKTAPPTPGL